MYVKPHEIDVSSSETDDDECEHCLGHVEKKKKKKSQPLPENTKKSGGKEEEEVKCNENLNTKGYIII